MKVCIGSALHPAFHQAGASGLWTPLLVARLGYCEYNCTLCGQAIGLCHHAAAVRAGRGDPGHHSRAAVSRTMPMMK